MCISLRQPQPQEFPVASFCSPAFHDRDKVLLGVGVQEFAAAADEVEGVSAFAVFVCRKSEERK